MECVLSVFGHLFPSFRFEEQMGSFTSFSLSTLVYFIYITITALELSRVLVSRGLCFDEIYGSSVLYIPGMFSSSRDVVESVFCAALFGDSNVARSGMILLHDL